MKLIRCIAMCVWVAYGASLVAAPADRNTVTNIDATSGSLTVSDGRGGFKTYRTKPNTEVLLNNQKAQFSDIKLGMTANVTTAEAGIASRILVSGGGFKAGTKKVAPPESRVRVQATNYKAKPEIVGNVSAGQTVTIVPIKVWWTGGGSKGKQYCDWRGYPNTNPNGKPWMALVAEIGDASFAPTGNTFTFVVPNDGTLVLYANDEKIDDNAGYGDVTVTVSGK